MQLFEVWEAKQYLLFFMTLMRFAGFFSVFPLFRRPYCPGRVGMALALITTALLVPTIAADETLMDIPSHATGLVVPALREATVGIAVGFTALMILLAGQLAGQYLDLQMGFFTASQIDPVMGGRLPLVGQYLYFVALITFVGFNGHHIVLAALRDSLDKIPVGTPLSVGGFPIIFDTMGWLFYTSLQIALPVMAALFVASVGLGIIGRAMPQLNVFVLGIPLRILVGFTLLLALVPLYATHFRITAGDRIKVLFQMLEVW